MGQFVAIKLVPLTPKAQKNLLHRELAAWKRLSQKPRCQRYVVCLYDYGVGTYKGEKYIVLVMEYLGRQSQDLEHFAFSQWQYQPSPEELHEVFRQLVKGLRYIHSQNVYHRDIKESNVMVQYTKNKFQLKYIDLGLSCVRGTDPCQIPVGTPDYFDFNLARRVLGLKQHDPLTPDELKAADIYALGTTMYAITYLQHPIVVASAELSIPELSVRELMQKIVSSTDSVIPFEAAPENKDSLSAKQRAMVKKLNHDITSLVVPDITERIRNFDRLKL
jgi:serine/threonine protein kinase